MKTFSTRPLNKKARPRVKYGIMHDAFTLKDYAVALNGLSRAKGSSILAVGCVRNIDTSILDHNILKLQDTLNVFKDYHIFLYENDSTKEFKDHLKNRQNDKLTVQSENLKLPKLGGGRDYNRVYCMSVCRNKYVDFFHKNMGYDYVMVFDFDLYDFRQDGIFHTIGLDHWDMVGANGLQYVDGKFVYYDIFALIEQNYKTYADGEPRNTVNVWHTLHSVFACFGGIGIYTKDAFIAGEKYGVPVVRGDVQSEHSSFAINMHKNSRGRIFMNPCMVAIR